MRARGGRRHVASAVDTAVDVLRNYRESIAELEAQPETPETTARIAWYRQMIERVERVSGVAA